MGEAFIAGTPARVRIKGRAASCIRFGSIAVAFMMAWVLISSELGYYSRLFGDQILLELSLAFAVPSIPVLIISGQVEKVMDRIWGPVQSMAVRLLFGLAGCTACCAVFPFLPQTHAALLWIVAVLGMLSAIAFSTSYQFVQNFRHADIIALGLGGVVTGPLVLVLQLSLDVGPNPHRWQWISMFEVTACVTALGLVSAVSLFGQYWRVLTGEEEYIDVRQPLLDPEDRRAQQQEQDREERREARNMTLARMRTQHLVLPPDPMIASGMLSPEGMRWPGEDERGVPRLQRMASAGALAEPSLITQDISAHHKLRALRATSSLPGRLHSSAQHLGAHVPSITQGSGSGAPWRVPSQDSSRHSSRLGYGQGSAAWHAETAHQHLASTTETVEGGESGGASPRPNGDLQQHSAASQSAPALNSAFLGANTEQLTQALDGGDDDGASDTHPQAMSLREETWTVMQYAGQVLTAFLVSVTVTYLIFPFFTYVKSTGLVGEELPKVLFYVRIFSDLLGRFAPRIKALMIRRAPLLSLLATLKLALCILFFVYLKAPTHYHHDTVFIAFIVFIWLLGGYINTSSNILAPALVPTAVVGRASALLALVFQVAHFAGLLLAVVLAYVLYGDVVG